MILDTKQITKRYDMNGSKRSRNFIFCYFIRRYSLTLLGLSQIFELRHILKNLLIILLPALSSILLTRLVNMKNAILWNFTNCNFIFKYSEISEERTLLFSG